MPARTSARRRPDPATLNTDERFRSRRDVLRRLPESAIVKKVQPPEGLSRLLYRTPIYVYRIGFGWLFGSRLMLLNHVGRVSGKPGQTILEVAARDPADGSFIVGSGWGPTAAWYRNVLRTPDVSIQVGRHTILVTAVPLTEDGGSRNSSHGMRARHRAGGQSSSFRGVRFFGRRVGGRLPGGWSTNAVRAVRPAGLGIPSPTRIQSARHPRHQNRMTAVGVARTTTRRWRCALPQARPVLGSAC